MTSIVDCVKNGNSRMLGLLVSGPGYSQQDLDKGFVQAVRESNIQCAQILLNAGISLTGNIQSMVLKTAIDSGNVTLLKMLFEAGCDVNAYLMNRGTPLHYSVRCGRDACVKELLQAGADMEARDSEGCTPVIVSAICQTLKCMKQLLDAGCDANKTDNNGRCALHFACHKAVGAELLLSYGANPDVQDCDGNCPLHLASVEGFDVIVNLLVSYNCNPDFVNEFGLQAIHYLAMKDHWKGIEDIAHCGGQVNLPDKKMNIPLWYAVNHNRPNAVKALLRANCNTDSPQVEDGKPAGGCPLKTALEKKLFQIAKLLILAGCNLAPLYEWIAEQNAQPEEELQPSLFVVEDENDTSDEEEDEEEMAKKDAMDWFGDWLHKPHSLQQTCRIYIRQHIGQGIQKKEEALPLPKSIRDYVTLREVEDHHIEGFVM